MKFFREAIVLLLMIHQCHGSDNIMLLSHKKPAVSSSVYNGEIAGHGVDGTDSIFHTLINKTNFWHVDLGHKYEIRHVTIVNRGGIMYGRLKNLYIKFGNDLKDLIDCAFFKGPGKKNKKYTFPCKGIGRYVYLEQRVYEVFHLQEVEVFGSYIADIMLLSHKKPAFSSSVYNGEKASHGVDGITSKGFHTLISNTNFWYVDLKDKYEIRSVVILNILGIMHGRLKNLYIRFGNDLQNLIQCAFFKGPGERHKWYSFPCRGIARYVYLEQRVYEVFHLEEVEVYGSYIDNIMLLSHKKPAVSSSVYNGEIAGHGVDGTNSIFHTLISETNFWHVDLGHKYEISHVTILNIGGIMHGRLKNLYIRFGIDLKVLIDCAFFKGPGAKHKKYSFPCKGIGRYVYLEQRVNEVFHLEEVEVYGSYIDYIVLLLSHKKPAYSSSVYNGEKASHGVDGIIDKGFHTLISNTNFWYVDLEEKCKIRSVVILNILGIMHGRLKNLYISFGNDLQNLIQCAFFKGPGERHKWYSFPCRGIARYVYLEQRVYEVFHLEEVEVYGLNIDASRHNLSTEFMLLSRKKPTYSSSVYNGEVAGHGVDGTDSIFHTLISETNFWYVDLGHKYEIRHVIIVNRGGIMYGRLKNLYIKFGNDLKDLIECAFFKGPGEKRQMYYFSCMGIARYVYLEQRVYEVFHLEEVEVYGFNATKKFGSWSEWSACPATCLYDDLILIRKRKRSVQLFYNKNEVDSEVVMQDMDIESILNQCDSKLCSNA